MKKYQHAAAAVLFLALGMTSAFGQTPIRRYDVLRGGGLGLTDAQYEKIQDLRLKFEKEILALESQWRALGLEIDALAIKGKSYEAELKKIQTIEMEIDRKHQEHWSQIRSMMSEDQWAFFERFGDYGLGRGLGWGPGRGYGRGLGYGASYGLRRGYGGFSRFGAGYGRGYGAGYGRGFGAAYRRGSFCPWRWR